MAHKINDFQEILTLTSPDPYPEKFKYSSEMEINKSIEILVTSKDQVRESIVEENEDFITFLC